MHTSHVQFLVCPQDGSPLSINEIHERDGDFIRSGSLVSSSGAVYRIVEYVPRFTGEDYEASFSVEWERHPWILHQSRSDLQIYWTRFNDETRWEQDLTGQLVIEAACGPGALTPYRPCRNPRAKSADLKNDVFQWLVLRFVRQPVDILRESAFSARRAVYGTRGRLAKQV